MGSSALSRRNFLLGTGSLAAGAGKTLASEWRSRGTPGTRLILLGTGGGPRPMAQRAGPSQVIVVDGVPYVVDCGEGVARQLVSARIDPGLLAKIFITRQHSGRNVDYVNLTLLARASGLATPVDAYGPPPIARMTDGSAPLIREHELIAPGVVMEDVRVRVTAAPVKQPPPSFAYRFDTADRSIVISGSTASCDDLLKLSQGADILVHEALYPPAIERLVKRAGNASRLVEQVLASHTKVEDVGRLAERAGVHTLVLSQLVPGDDPSITDDLWREQASKHFRGEVIVGKDLLEI